MKMLSLRILLSFYCLPGLVTCFLIGCENNMDCQAPPPSFYFRIIGNGFVYPTRADTSAKLTISYVDGGRLKTIADLREIDGLFRSSEIISSSWALDNPEFTLELNNQELSKVKFDTYMNNAKCQGWASVSNVYENGQLLQKTDNHFFVFGLK
jgi:hypothetical protein